MSKLAHSFTVNQVPFSSEVDVMINVQKRREDVLYKSTSRPDNVNLSFAQIDTLNSDNTLSIRDRSTSLPENRSVLQLTDQLLTGVRGFNIETDQFLVTDVFADVTSSVVDVPLFYKHRTGYSLQTGESFQNFQLLDSNYDPIFLEDSYVDTNAGTVYSNLQNSFDFESGLSELYYVAYTVKKASGLTVRYVEILNNQPVFREAQLEDLNEFGTIAFGKKVYLIEDGISGNFYITLPSYTNYAVRRLSSSRLSIIQPSTSLPEDPWFVEINNGQFIAGVETVSGINTSFKYRVAEFGTQSWSPYQPYKQTSETATRVTSRVVKVSKDSIFSDADLSIFLDLFVYSSDGSLKFAFSSNPDNKGASTPLGDGTFENVLLGDSLAAGTNVNDATNPIAGSSLDEAKGLIVIPTGYEISSDNTIEVNYYYEEKRYQYTLLNLNPLAETDLVEQTVVLFCVPESIAANRTESIYYLLVNEDGIVIDTNFEDFDEDYQASGLWYDRDPSLVSWAPASGIDFVQKYSVEADTPNTYAYLILGEIQTREPSSVTQVNLNDIRLRGGGIQEGLTETAVLTNPEVEWFWDIGSWDGLPYPGGGAYFVDVPVTLLEECGGNFTPDTVREIVFRHTAAGEYPVIHKYNTYEPEITSIDITVSGHIINWSQAPDDVVFDIWENNIEDGDYTLLVSGLSNNPAGNTYTYNVPADSNRYVVITGRQGQDGEVCFGGPIND